MGFKIRWAVPPSQLPWNGGPLDMIFGSVSALAIISKVQTNATPNPKAIVIAISTLGFVGLARVNYACHPFFRAVLSSWLAGQLSHWIERSVRYWTQSVFISLIFISCVQFLCCFSSFEFLTSFGPGGRRCMIRRLRFWLNSFFDLKFFL